MFSAFTPVPKITKCLRFNSYLMILDNADGKLSPFFSNLVSRFVLIISHNIIYLTILYPTVLCKIFTTYLHGNNSDNFDNKHLTHVPYVVSLCLITSSFCIFSPGFDVKT